MILGVKRTGEDKTARIAVSVRASIFLFFTLSLLPGIAALDFNDSLAPEALADRLVGQMTDQEALAQTFMLGWVGAGSVALNPPLGSGTENRWC